MATIEQSLRKVRESIQNAYPEPEAGTMAQLVLEHVLRMSRLRLSLNQQQELSLEQQEEVNNAISRLMQQEPVQYVLGIAHFYDLELQVDERVLIPRPETEELVDLVIKEYRGKAGLQVLDICTGSGCIPVALAVNMKGSKIFGIEVSAGALEVAKANADKYRISIEWLHQDIFDEVPIPGRSLDIITSNPPYVLEEEKAFMHRNVLEHEPHLALFVPDTDPLKFYKRIAEVGSRLLKKGGKLYFEINERYGKDVCNTLLQAGFSEAEVVQDLFNKDRIVRAIL